MYIENRRRVGAGSCGERERKVVLSDARRHASQILRFRSRGDCVCFDFSQLLRSRGTRDEIISAVTKKTRAEAELETGSALEQVARLRGVVASLGTQVDELRRNVTALASTKKARRLQ